MQLTKKNIMSNYNVTLQKAKMIRKEDKKEITGWLAIANDNCLLGSKDDIVAYGATLAEIVSELNDTPVCFTITD